MTQIYLYGDLRDFIKQENNILVFEAEYIPNINETFTLVSSQLTNRFKVINKHISFLNDSFIVHLFVK